MDKNSTLFLNFNEIDISETDLIADAFAIDQQISNLLNHFDHVHYEPDDELITRILQA